MSRVLAPLREIPVHDQAEPVVNAPNHEVPGCSVPEPAQRHGQQEIAIGLEFAASRAA